MGIVVSVVVRAGGDPKACFAFGAGSGAIWPFDGSFTEAGPWDWFGSTSLKALLRRVVAPVRLELCIARVLDTSLPKAFCELLGSGVLWLSGRTLLCLDILKRGAERR